MKDEDLKLNSIKRKIPILQKAESLGSNNDLEDDEVHELKVLIAGEKIIDKEKFVAGSVINKFHIYLF
jgi:hypothetical protein